MSSFRLGALAIIAALTLPAAAIAQSASPAMTASPMPMATMMMTPMAMPVHTPLPDKPTDFTAFKPLIGSWTCKRIVATGKTGGVGRISHDTYALALGGAWLKATTTAAKQGTMKRPYMGEFYIGYDPLMKYWVGMEIGGDGSFDYATSPGIAHGVFVFTENAATADGFPVWTYTTTIKDPKHVTYKYVGPTSLTTKIDTIVTSCTKV